MNGVWVTTAWTVVMSDETERTVYAATAEDAMRVWQRKLIRDGSPLKVTRAFRWEEEA